eukprot:5497361-Lingulodinium_polyedra.AAC.1
MADRQPACCAASGLAVRWATRAWSRAFDMASRASPAGNSERAASIAASPFGPLRPAALRSPRPAALLASRPRGPRRLALR